jgi:hypothetical protein
MPDGEPVLDSPAGASTGNGSGLWDIGNPRDFR